tara:strand:+ start:260 stop:1426 length:1167 start_codon:yes stop_codon:yes gene_type:complete
MKNHNKRDWIKYIFIIVIAGLFTNNFFYKDNNSLEDTQLAQDQRQTNLNQIKHLPSQSETQVNHVKVQDKVVTHIEDNSKSLSEPEETTNNIVDHPYTVQSDYINQDFFDEALCTSDEVRANYQPMLVKALKGFGSQYQHSTYQINEYITLNLYASRLSTYFIKQLQDRIKSLHHIYISMLGDIAKRKIILNLVVTASRDDYDHYVSVYSDHSQSTLGVYFGGLNLAFVDYQRADDKGLKTATHEIVHALHAHILGRTPRMFNEGMAEYFEDLIIKNGKPSIQISKEKTMDNILDLSHFIHDSEWTYGNARDNLGQLYYSSWAWILFMFDYDLNGRQALTYFMEKEQVNPCTSILGSEFYSIIQQIYSTFDSDFLNWQDQISNSADSN